MYQFGNFVLPAENLVITREIGIKNNLENLDYGHGRVRVNRMRQDYTEDTIYNISFLNTKYTYDELDKIFFSKPQKVYFVEKTKDVNLQDQVKVYFGYGHTFSSSEVRVDCKLIPREYNISIRMIGRRYLIEDSRLLFVPFDYQTKGTQQSWGVTDLTSWGVADGFSWGDKYQGQSVIFNDQTTLNKLELLGDCCNSLGFFDYYDLFFAQEIARLDKYKEVNLTGTDGQLTTFNTSTNPLFLGSTAQNNTVIFELGQLAINQSVEISSNHNMAGFKITCLGNCPPILSIFCHKAQKLYNADTNQPLNFLDYKLEIIGQNNKLFTLPNQEDLLLIKRNFIGNYQIRIGNLPTYY